MEKKILSIIVPVYNVEAYIHSCVESLLQQGLDEDSYEIILIDDGTPDNSIEAIKDLITKHANIIVLHQENQGISTARNHGVKEATGKYIIYVDSDDLLIEGSIKTLIAIALREEPDIIMADYVIKAEEEIASTKIQRQEPTDISIKNGRRLLMENLDPNECYVWRTVYKREFLNQHNIKFIEGISFEDIIYTHECLLKAGKSIRVNYPFYIYRRRHGTLSSAIREKTIYDLNKSMESLWQLAHMEELTSEERQRLSDNLFAVFSKTLWYISHVPQLLKCRRAFVQDLKNRIPDLTFHHGRKQRVVSWFFKIMPNTYLKIRSFA